LPDLGTVAKKPTKVGDVIGRVKVTLSAFASGVTTTLSGAGSVGSVVTPNDGVGVAATSPVAIVRVASPVRTAPPAVSPRSFVICRTRVVKRLSVPILDSLLLSTLTGVKRPQIE
jgi:hypothetical protein